MKKLFLLLFLAYSANLLSARGCIRKLTNNTPHSIFISKVLQGNLLMEEFQLEPAEINNLGLDVDLNLKDFYGERILYRTEENIPYHLCIKRAFGAKENWDDGIYKVGFDRLYYSLFLEFGGKKISFFESKDGNVTLKCLKSYDRTDGEIAFLIAIDKNNKDISELNYRLVKISNLEDTNFRIYKNAESVFYFDISFNLRDNGFLEANVECVESKY